jgi:hypothetical protein
MSWLQDALHNENRDRIRILLRFLSGLVSKMTALLFLFISLIAHFLYILSCIACNLSVRHAVLF